MNWTHFSPPNNAFLPAALALGLAFVLSPTPVGARNSDTFIADAGDNQLVAVGQTAHLDGTRSLITGSGYNGDALGSSSYSWTLARPSGSHATLSDSTSPIPTFVVDVAGDYVATLAVSVDNGRPGPPSTVTLSTVTAPPIVNAGLPLHATVGQTITLDGSGSYDPNGKLLTFAWQVAHQPAGSRTTLQNANTPFPTFIVDAEGDYSFSLTVSNGSHASSRSNLVSTGIVPPRIKLNTPTITNTWATIDASKSFDVSGQQLYFSWNTVWSSPNGTCQNESQTSVASVAISLAVPCIVQLTLYNNTFPTLQTVALYSAGGPPTAAPGNWQHVNQYQNVNLNGSNSSSSTGIIPRYSWSFVWKPAGSQAVLANSTTAYPTFQVDVPGDYLLQLAVSDGTFSRTATTLVTTLAAQPTATAPAPLTAQTGLPATLNGQADPAAGVLIGSWSVQNQPQFVALANLPVISYVNPSTATFLAQQADTFTVQYLVWNGRFIAADTTTVTVTPPRIVSVVPGFVTQGTLHSQVVINATDTNFVQGRTTVDFGLGILVNSVHVNDPRTLTVDLTATNFSFGPRTVTVTTGAQTLTNNQFLIAEPITISPPSGAQGSDASIEIASSPLSPIGFPTFYTFGGGLVITSSVMPSVGIIDSQVTIDPQAPLGLHTLLVTSNGRTFAGSYIVTPGHLAIGVSPQLGLQGQSYALRINGVDTHFATGLTTVSFGADVTTDAIYVKDFYTLRADITIANGAAGGPRTVTVTTGSETVTFSFNVIAPVSLTSVSPAVVISGATTTLQVSGQNTHFVQGQTIARLLGCSISTTQNLVVNSPTSASVALTVAGNVLPAACTLALDTATEQATWAVTLNIAGIGSLTPSSGALGATVTPELVMLGASQVMPSVVLPQGITGYILSYPGFGIAQLKFVIAANTAVGNYTILFPTDVGYYSATFSVHK